MDILSYSVGAKGLRTARTKSQHFVSNEAEKIDPTTLQAGDTWLNTDSNKEMVIFDSMWVEKPTAAVSLKEVYSKAEVDAVQATQDSATALVETNADKAIKLQTTVNFTSDANLTLTADSNLYGRVEITDTGTVLTVTRDVILDTSERNILVTNATAQSLVFKTSAGTGVTVGINDSIMLRCDTSDIIVDSQHTFVVDDNYIDLLAIGANPQAKLYNDGTVIGSTDNGNYIRYTNGELRCMQIGTTLITSILAGNIYYNTNVFSFPVKFVEEDIKIFNSSKYLIGTTWGGRFSSLTNDGVTLSIIGAGASSEGYPEYLAIGRWK